MYYNIVDKMARDIKKENWVYVESNEGKDYYVNTIPAKNMIYFIGEKKGEKIVPIKGDNVEYLPPIYQILIKKYRKEYLEAKKAEKEKQASRW